LLQFRLCVDSGRQLDKEWEDLFAAYTKSFPEEGEALRRHFRGELPDGWEADIPVFPPDPKGVATRVASGKVLNAIAGRVRNLLGGSADLAPSTKTLISGSPDQSAQNPGGRNLRYGVREHGMGAIVNGMALHGGVIPYGSTFLIFSDYLKPSLRVAALMGVHSLFVFTHDSIAVGEDGPTHQPVEQLVSMRAIPEFTVIRPADANETAEAWKVAITRKSPIALILTRQNVPTLDREKFAAAKGLAKGAYILSDCQGEPDILLIASGSEVTLAVNAQERLASEKGIKARVISMPSWELFSEQSQEYRDSVLPPRIQTRLAIEAGSRYGWAEWVGSQGDIISVDRFGSSAPGGEVMKRYGFTVENVMERAEALIASKRK
jgi:transketolase